MPNFDEPFGIYLAAEGRSAELAAELGPGAEALGGGLWWAPGPPRPRVAWARDVWLAPERRAIASIGDAARQLRAVQRNWALVPVASVRRSRLVEAKLPPLKRRAWRFPSKAPTAPLGAFCLLDDATMLASPATRSPVPGGEVRFEEDREGPPSRAYLKLWEALFLLRRWPQPGERVIDLGASPGGWTWVAARLGAEVRSVDKAPLDPAVAAMSGVTFEQGSAFALPPEPVDWLLSDVICYPERLLATLERWRGYARAMVCTIKLQGAQEPPLEGFRALGEVRHLCHNKHELTLLVAPEADG